MMMREIFCLYQNKTMYFIKTKFRKQYSQSLSSMFRGKGVYVCVNVSAGWKCELSCRPLFRLFVPLGNTLTKPKIIPVSPRPDFQ